MRKYIKGTWILLVLMLFCLPQMTLANTNNDQLDAILVIDASGSMKETDPNKLGLEGVKLFIDMMAATGNQVGIVTYGSEVDEVYPMTKVNSQSDKEAIKDFVDGITRELEYTDITAGLSKAMSMESSRDTSDGNSPLIIIFTDGNNAVGGVKDRDYATIDKELDGLLQEAKSKDYPIYTIGLNDNGKLNEDYLKNISDQTNALAFIAKDPAELPDILTQIFAAHSNLKVQSLPSMVGTGNFEEININIPNGNVLEANISATASQAVELRLVDPSGKYRGIPSNDITLHKSNSYHLLKVLRPMEGDWKLYVKGMPRDQINIDLVYNYDLDVTLEPLSQTSFVKGEDLKVSAYLSLQGTAIVDDALYQNAKAMLILRNTQSGVETRVDMGMNNQKFSGSYQLNEEGEFEVSVLVEDTSFQRESTPISITVGTKGNNPVSTGSPNGPGNELDPNKKEGKSPLFFIGIGIITLGLIGAAVIALKKLQETKRPLVGQVVIELRDNTTGKLSPPQYKKLNVFQGKVSLHALLSFAPEFKEAEQIIFKAASGDKVMLINKSPYVIEKSGRAVKADMGVELKKGDKLGINMADSGQTVQVEYLL